MDSLSSHVILTLVAQWQSIDSRLGGPSYESCAALCILFTLHCSSSLNCRNEYLAVDTGECMCTSSLRGLIAAWLNASKMVFDYTGVPKSSVKH